MWVDPWVLIALIIAGSTAWAVDRAFTTGRGLRVKANRKGFDVEAQALGRVRPAAGRGSSSVRVEHRPRREAAGPRNARLTKSQLKPSSRRQMP
jgi:hypothetical protein